MCSSCTISIVCMYNSHRQSQRSYWQLVVVRHLTSLKSEATLNRMSVTSISEKMMRYVQSSCSLSSISLLSLLQFQWSPLMWACENNHFEIGRLLLKYKPQVNIQDKVQKYMYDRGYSI